MSDGRLLVLYDADCAFCARSARLLHRLDRRGHLDLVPLQTATIIAGAPSLESLLQTMHVRDGDGRWSVGGAAWIRISQEVGLLRPLALLARLPLIRRLVEPTYSLIAANRQRMSRLLGDDACRI